jgi:pheromone shutdown protein TraB
VPWIIYGFFRGGAGAGADMVTWWVLANGILAGLGALIALGHPLTVLSSILAAPLTSLNPMIAAGWVSGLVEAFSRKPKVKDFENLPSRYPFGQGLLAQQGYPRVAGGGIYQPGKRRRNLRGHTHDDEIFIKNSGIMGLWN